MSLQDDLARGAKAERLLNDETLTAAFEGVRAAIHDSWESTDSPEKAEDLRRMLMLIRAVRKNLEVWVRDGKLAEVQIEDARKRKKVTGLFR